MSSEIYLEDILEGCVDPPAARANIMDSIIAALARKYIPQGKKIQFDLTKTAELDLIITQVEPGIFKLKWEEVPLDS